MLLHIFWMHLGYFWQVLGFGAQNITSQISKNALACLFWSTPKKSRQAGGTPAIFLNCVFPATVPPSRLLLYFSCFVWDFGVPGIIWEVISVILAVRAPVWTPREPKVPKIPVLRYFCHQKVVIWTRGSENTCRLPGILTDVSFCSTLFMELADAKWLEYVTRASFTHREAWIVEKYVHGMEPWEILSEVPM